MLKLKSKATLAVTLGLSAIIQLTSAVSAEEQLTPDQYFNRALQKANNAEYAAAIADYDMAIEKKPQFWQAYGNRAAARFNMHDYQSALKDCETSIVHLPPNAALNELKKRIQDAIASSSSNEAANAAANAAEARRRMANQLLLNAQLGGDFADPSTMLMMQAQRRGLIPNSNPIPEIRRAPSMVQSDQGQSGNSPFTVSSTQSAGGNPFAENANAAPSRYEAAAPTNQESVIASNSPKTQSRTEENSSPFTVESKGTATAQSHFDKGCELAAATNFAEAIKEYNQAIQLDPNFGKAYANRGSARFNTLDYQGALDDFDNAVRLLPDNPAVKALRDQIAKALNK
jgi:tetratricopeptide (TPR) repeat protein